jgi:WD40 repeat protein
MCGEIIASGSVDKTVKLWNFKTKKEIGTLDGHSASVRSVALTKNAEVVVSSSNDKNIMVWSVSHMIVLYTLTGHTQLAQQVGLTSDDRYIFSGSESEDCVIVWEINGGLAVCLLDSANEAEEWLKNYPELRGLAERFIS